MCPHEIAVLLQRSAERGEIVVGTLDRVSRFREFAVDLSQIGRRRLRGGFKRGQAAIGTALLAANIGKPALDPGLLGGSLVASGQQPGSFGIERSALAYQCRRLLAGRLAGG